MTQFNKVKYNNEYNKANYTDIKLRIPKGFKEQLEQHWKSKGYKSLNAYINTLIQHDMYPDRKENQ